MAAALTAVSCGGDDAQLLPGSTARDITANLETVEQLADEGDCAGAESAAQQVSEQIAALDGVDARLKRALENGAARLNEVVATCTEATTEAIAPATVPPVEETTKQAEKEREREKKKEEKTAEKEERQAEREERTEEESQPALPPQAEGEGKGLEDGSGGGGEAGGEEEPSGGVSPGSPVGGENR